MNIEDRLALVRQVGEEIVTEDELRALLEAKPHPICYDGFEPSGRIHIAQGILRAINVNKMAKAGCTFKMFVADWHAWANNKMGGDLAKIQTVGHYFVEVWRAAGMDLGHVKFVWASEFVTDEAYWKKVMNIARDSSLDRILRTTQIMGRSDKDKLSASQILYPCMQAADIFHLEADITQLGMDQRKVNMLAREVGPKLGFYKPVVVSHHMLMGLQAPPADQASGQELSRLVSENFNFNAAGHVQGIRDEGAEVLLGQETAARVQRDLIVLNTWSGPRTWQDIEMMIPAIVEDYRVRLPDPKSTPPGTMVHGAELDNLAALRAFKRMHEGAKRAREQATIDRATKMKMSKSNPDSAIFMTDSPADVERKMKNAFCPQKQVEENPVLEYFRYIIFQRHWLDPAKRAIGESPIVIERPEKFGGNSTYATYAELEAAFASGAVHPMDLKKAATKYVNEILEPTRKHFETDENARKLKEQVDGWQVTR